MKEELLKKIESRLEVLSENLKYQIEGNCEALSDVYSIQYLLYLNEKQKTKTPC